MQIKYTIISTDIFQTITDLIIISISRAKNWFVFFFFNLLSGSAFANFFLTRFVMVKSPQNAVKVCFKMEKYLTGTLAWPLGGR